MKNRALRLSLLFVLISSAFTSDFMEHRSKNTLSIKSCQDFDINGLGTNESWASADWIELNPLGEPNEGYTTKFKIRYSESGIYLLAHCEDTKISTEFTTDQSDVWEGDVFEAFFQPDEKNPLYFEYEINPLGTELALLVPNNDGDFMGWAPWHYEGERKIKKAVTVEGGKQNAGAEITSWTAEVFIPFQLMKGLNNTPPKSGTQWKGNFYRMDYDTGERKAWAWCPIETNFHQYEKYGTLVFD